MMALLVDIVDSSVPAGPSESSLGKIFLRPRLEHSSQGHVVRTAMVALVEPGSRAYVTL